MFTWGFANTHLHDYPVSMGLQWAVSNATLRISIQRGALCIYTEICEAKIN